IAHESSWVIENRNPGLSRREIGDRLLRAYGADRIIWAGGLAGEDITDYHIDSLARFTPSGRILIQLPDEPDPNDPFHMAALETYHVLRAAGLSLDVIPDPVSQRVQDPSFAGAYANYYVCNGAVLFSEMGDHETDQVAGDALRAAYPGREIVALNTDALGWIGGGIHCATQQIPAA
ncbi:MAG: agmatine deiminase family protein, partial [Pseudomonadota bacterium]